MNNRKRTRVGLVGAGYVSSYHIRALRSLDFVEIVGIADVDIERATSLAAAHAIPRAYRTLQEMAEAKPEVVHILTPPESHCALTLAALDMGCHVFVEKPMALSVEECDQMIAKAERAGKILSVNHSARLDPIVQKALALVRGGAIGEIVTVDFLRSSGYPPYPGGPLPAHYRQGGYPFRDIGVHGLYLLEAFLGEIKDLSVSYSASGRDPNLMFDEWRALAHCQKGFGQLQLSWNVRPMQSELVVQGTRGVLRIDRFFQTCRIQKDHPIPKSALRVFNAATSAFGSVWDLFANTTRFATKRLVPSPAIHQGVVEFHKALVNGDPPPVSPQEGRRVTYWTELAARPADVEKRQARTFISSDSHPVLVTGGTGFLGRVLVKRLLDSGCKVRLLARRKPVGFMADHPGISVIIGDLGDPNIVDTAVRGTSLVYHVGAAMGGGQADFERGTVAGTKNVVASCLRYQTGRLVYVSSLGVLDYCGLSSSEVVTESSSVEAHPDRRGNYTATKVAAEKIVLEAVREQKLPAVILRPGQIFGPGAEKFAPYGTIPLGKRWVVVGSGDCRLPLVYVEDVVDAMLLAATKDVCGSIFQLVDDEVVTQKVFLKARQESVRDGVKISYMPKLPLYSIAVAVELLGKLAGRGVPLTRYRLDSLKNVSNFDCTAAKTRLLWTPRVGVRDGLKRTFPASPAITEKPEPRPELSLMR